MGKFVFQNAYFAIDSTAAVNRVLSTYVKSITLNYSRAEVDSTCMGDEGIARMAGLRDWSMDLEFAQDYGSSAVDRVMFGALGSTAATATVWFSPTTNAISASNPRYKGEGRVFEYTPASGSPGDFGTATASIRCAACSSEPTAWLYRDITP